MVHPMLKIEVALRMIHTGNSTNRRGNHRSRNQTQDARLASSQRGAKHSAQTMVHSSTTAAVLGVQGNSSSLQLCII